nr:hypothetical protein ISGA_08900 [Gordonia sp. NB41Y]
MRRWVSSVGLLGERPTHRSVVVVLHASDSCRRVDSLSKSPASTPEGLKEILLLGATDAIEDGGTVEVADRG